MNTECENVKKELKSIRESEEDAKRQIVKCMTFIRELVSVHNSVLQDKAKIETS